MSDERFKRGCMQSTFAEWRRLKLQKLGIESISEEDVLTGLPVAVLRRLCLILSECPVEALNETSPLASASKNTPALQALGSCCKQLSCIVDDVRPSICFSVKQLWEVQSYLQRMPGLASVVISDWNSPHMNISLSFLHSISPRLTSLTLRDHMTPCVGMVIAQSLHLWSSTLTCLKLSGMQFHRSPQTGHDGMRFLSQLSVLTDLNVSDVPTSLMTEDIAGCTSLLRLSLHMSKESEALNTRTLDLSSCKSLQELRCSNYKLFSLSLSGLHLLQLLDCSDNAISTLEGISTCTALQFVSCSRNSLEALDLRGCHGLRDVQCDSNPLAKLQVSSCAMLTRLSCESCEATELDLSGCVALQQLVCRGSKIRSLDLQACRSLQHLDAAGSSALLMLTHLTHLTQLHTLNLMGTQVRCLDVTGCVTLTGLECSSCRRLGVVSAEGCSKLVFLSFDDCPHMDELNCRGCDSLSQMHFEGSSWFCDLTLEKLKAHGGFLGFRWWYEARMGDRY